MALTPDNVDQLRASEHFQSLLAHPGFKLVLDAAQTRVAQSWVALLNATPEELPRVQGFIEGANFVLEYADAAVREAQRVLEQHRRDQEAAFEASRNHEAYQHERTNRRGRVGASLD